MSILNCTVCQGQMREVNKGGVLIDTCTQCRGVWLDRGELEKLLGAGREEAKADSEARRRFEHEVDSFRRDPDDWRRRHPYDAGNGRHRYDDDYPRKKKRFDIFDIFD